MGSAAREINLDYVAPPTIRRFIEARSKAKYLQGPFGSGKSVGALWDRFLAGQWFCATYKLPRRTLVVRKHWTVLKDSTLKSFLEWFGELGSWRATDHEFSFPWGHEFIFCGLDRPEHVQKVQSREITDFIVDEASEFDETLFFGLLGRIPRFPKVSGKASSNIDFRACAVLVSNPPEETSWIVDHFERNPLPGFEQFLQPSGLSPAAENVENLPADYYQTLASQYTTRPDLLARFVHGKRAVIVRGKAVYHEYSAADHATSAPQQWPGASVKIVRGWDNSGNTPACVVGWVNPDGCFVVAKEFVTDLSGIVEFGRDVTAWCSLEFPGAQCLDVCDPAGHNSYTDARGGLTSNAALMREKLGVTPLKAVQTFSVRREALADRLNRRNRLRIYVPGCPRLVSGLEGGYCYKQLPEGRGYSVEPEKNQYSHVVEALQYALTHVDAGTHKETPQKLVRALRKQGRDAGRWFA